MKKVFLSILLLMPFATQPNWFKKTALLGGGAITYMVLKPLLDQRREILFDEKRECESLADRGIFSPLNPMGLKKPEMKDAKSALQEAQFSWAHPILSLSKRLTTTCAYPTLIKDSLDQRKEELFLKKKSCQSLVDKGVYSFLNPMGLKAQTMRKAKTDLRKADFSYSHPILSLIAEKIKTK